MEFTNYEPGQLIEGTDLLEDGRYECVIVSANDDHDREGNVVQKVKFQPVVGPEVYAWPVLVLKRNDRGIRFGVAIADALRIDRAISLSLPPKLLVGKMVLVSTRIWEDEQGKHVGVDAIRGTWTERGGAIPAAPQSRPAQTQATAPAAAPKPRTAAAAVATARGDEVGGSDDVPF